MTNPAPGGGTSANSPFAVNNPVPTITSLSPASATVGGAAFTLTVNGTGFLSGAAVTFNGNSRVTTFVSATQVTAAITAADIATAGTFNVTVTNPAPTAGPSAAANFHREQSSSGDYVALAHYRDGGRSNLYADSERHEFCFYIGGELQRDGRDDNVCELHAGDGSHHGGGHRNSRNIQRNRDESGARRRHFGEFSVYRK